MKKPTRSEKEVFADLAALCGRPGYVHAIAHFCFRDNVIGYAGRMKEDDMRQMFSPSRLIRTEINTLLGLMIKGEIDWAVPAPAILRDYADTTEALLSELHECLSAECFKGLSEEALKSGTFNPFEKGDVLRESIFYSGEAAYNFQYIDMAARKYADDAPWLQAHRGFTIDDASKVAGAVGVVLTDHFGTMRENMRKQPPEQRTMLPFFTFVAGDVAAVANLPIDVVERVLAAFELPAAEHNADFNALHDFNAITSTPLFRMPTGEFISLQAYSLAEAIYEAPFYWMVKDEAYQPKLTKHRGEFTENFVAERLRLVFGAQHVHLNVDIYETKAARISDIDILVLWGDRAIIVQTKSKRLTLEARKGNDLVIRDDFKKAVQAAYDQGITCATCLLDKGYKFRTPDGKDVVLPTHIKEVYLFCVVSDNYPALSFQARQFLKTKDVDRVQTPLVMDVFAIDATTEMLPSPLQFLSYVNRRSVYGSQLMASQELTILGYHLSHNLWMDPGVDFLQLNDDFSAALDIAMLVRRTGIQGAATPDGVLTRFEKTTVGRIVKEIEARPASATIELGFHLLAMSEDAVVNLSRGMDRLAARTRADGKLHDATFGRADGSGITFHCTDELASVAGPRLRSYCERRKYKEKAKAWFGLCMSSAGPNMRFGVSLTYPWTQDALLDEQTRDMQTPMPFDQGIATLLSGRRRTEKVGRNDPCPCGSGRKYKKCCLN